ncbi:SurA N-terminal domain-containing protein [Maricurvus nonylphenolicus]|uniref:SurA N-terminal domain-containing protein n=1 Tax=Maricurvus nonylphenolicus TaxID=1008307 RepID=UPI0036F3AE99
MLQTFRDNLKGTVAYILIGLIVVIFALTGAEALFSGTSTAGKAAEVNGETIADIEVRRGIQMRRQQMLQRFGEQLPADFISDERLREPVLNDLILRELIYQQAQDGGMAVAETTLDELITSAPQFQQDGKFSPQQYTMLLRNMGYTPAGYKLQLTKDLLGNQLTAGFVNSGFVTPAEMDQVTALTQQTRDYYYLTIPAASVADSVTADDEAVNAYYEENKPRYMSREQVTVDYIHASIDGLMDDIEVSEDELMAQYEQDFADFKGTSRQAAHILIEPQEDGSHEARLQEVQEKIAAGEDFAELAKTYSDDIGTKNSGGNLGFTSGDIFPEAFETALAALAVEQVSEPVETDAGVHLIKLMSLKAAEPPSFLQERDRIEDTLQRASAEERFVEVLDALPDLTYNADNLEDAAAELGLVVETSDPLTRSGGEGVLRDNRVLAAVFSDEVLVEGNTSEVLELAEDSLVVVRVNKHEPSRQQTLEEVKEQVVADVTAKLTAEALKAKAGDLKTKVAAGESVESLALANGYEWQVKLAGKRFDPEVDRALNQFVFGLEKPQADPVVDGVQLAGGDYVVVSLTAVAAGKLEEQDASQQRSISSRLAQQLGADDYQSYQAMVQQNAHVDRY